MNSRTQLTKSEAVAIVERFIVSELPKEDWYQQTAKDIKAIVLYGSTAKGLSRPYSDIDILLFMPLSIEKQYTIGEYYYRCEGREINIVIRSIEHLRNIAHEQKDLFQKEVFRGSVVIESVDDEAERLLAKIEKIQ